MYGTDTLFVVFIKQIPVAILSIDTQGEYRYPRGGTDTLRGGTDTLIGWKNIPPTAPNKSQRSPTARNTFGTIKQASKHQEKTNASLYNINMIKNCLRFPPKPRKGEEFNSELVEILSGEAKIVDVELG
ncbi:hypothetical protein GQ457_15G019610 [Hibiscus cannabinus]